ncbi:MAG: hypothetical protein WC335_08885 [Candidatus Omnitrophota bacterium]|jgi:uncharacterized membrane protein SpoIIM required for sporulation
MKKAYNFGDDLFLAMAFVTFAVGVVSRLLGIDSFWWGVTPHNLIALSMACLIFSIALSLYDIANSVKK